MGCASEGRRVRGRNAISSRAAKLATKLLSVCGSFLLRECVADVGNLPVENWRVELINDGGQIGYLFEGARPLGTVNNECKPLNKGT
jgi:hypothetical protein